MPAHLTILNALAAVKIQFKKDRVERNEVGGIAKIKGASTVRNALKKLKDWEYIEYTENKTISITDLGMEHANVDDIHIPTSNEDHHDQVRKNIKRPDIDLFDILLDGLPHAKEELRERSNKPKNSTWRNMLARFVKEYRIAYYPDKNTIRLIKAMFPVIPRPGPDDNHCK